MMRNIIYLSIIYLFICAFATAQPADNPCSHLVSADGSLYDLTALMEKGVQTIKGYDTSIEEKFDFSFSVCSNLPTGCGGSADPICSNPGTAGTCLCFEPCEEWSQWCYGQFSSSKVQPLDEGKGVILEYSKAETLASKIQLLCDYNYAGVDKYTISKQTYLVDVTILTDAACPISGGGISGGTIFLLVVLGVVVLYLIAGIMINKFSRMKNGREVMPNVDFWVSLPGLVVDGAKFSVSKITGKSYRSNYSTVE